jgi:polyisoprenoid-binding protein YceI
MLTMTTTLHRSLQFAVALGATAFVSTAAPLSFDFKDPKGVNNVQFHLDAPLESISGSGNGISGQIAFDPANPETLTGRIVIAASSLTVGNPMMREHLQGEKWLDVTKNPEIVFEAVKVANLRKADNRIDADVTGRLTVKGVTREVTVPVSFTHLPDKLGARNGNPSLKGDLLVVRSTFSINRSDFGIMAGQMTDKVAESIQLTLSLAGGAQRG